MKTRTWIILLSALLLVSILAASPLLISRPAGHAKIASEGTVIATVDLAVDQEFTVASATGSNTITVRNGAIAVTAADCPDGYCKDRGFCAGGLQIVCLPNKLEIRFVGETEVDGVVG